MTQRLPAQSPDAVLAGLRVAIVHPFLVSRGGGEKVVDALAELLPQAEIFTMMLDRSSLSPVLADRTIHTTFLDAVPGKARIYQFLSPLYDLATAQHDLSGFDLIISSGGPGAKTVQHDPAVPHIHYCHSPVRFLWDQFDTWLGRLPAVLRPAFSLTAGRQRGRDLAGVEQVDCFIANSNYIAERIARFYARESRTIYPPVDLSEEPALAEREALIAAAEVLGEKNAIVAGDFNLATGSFAFGEIMARAAWWQHGGFRPTYPGTGAFAPVMVLDHIASTRDWRSHGCERLPDNGSDHRALACSLSPNSRLRAKP